MPGINLLGPISLLGRVSRRRRRKHLRGSVSLLGRVSRRRRKYLRGSVSLLGAASKRAAHAAGCIHKSGPKKGKLKRGCKYVRGVARHVKGRR